MEITSQLLNELGDNPWVILLIFVVGYLLKILIDKRIDVVAERKNIEFKSKIDKEFEQFRSTLEDLRQQNQIKFFKLHEKRFEVILSIREDIMNLNGCLFNLTSPLKHLPDGKSLQSYEEELLKKTFDAYYVLQENFKKNRIYFGLDTCDLIDKIVTQSREGIEKYSSPELFLPHGANPNQADIDKYKVWDSIVLNAIPEALKILEDDFRHILGSNIK